MGHAARDRALSRGAGYYAIEPRGTGDAAPRGSRHRTLATLDGTLRTVSVAEPPILEFEVALDCLMLGRSLLGQQVQDVVAAIRYLWTIRPAMRPLLELRAYGPLSSLRALFAAALEPAIGTLQLHGLPLSYASIVHGEPGSMPPTAYLFDVLRHFDLGDVLALLAERTVCLAGTVDGRGSPLEPLAVRAAHRAGVASRQGGGWRPPRHHGIGLADRDAVVTTGKAAWRPSRRRSMGLQVTEVFWAAPTPTAVGAVFRRTESLDNVCCMIHHHASWSRV